MSPDEEIRRGHEAARLLDDPLLKAAFDEIEQGIVQAMRQVKIGDHAGQHELVLMLQLLGRVKGTLKTHLETGKLARLQKETMAQKARNLMRRVR